MCKNVQGEKLKNIRFYIIFIIILVIFSISWVAWLLIDGCPKEPRGEHWYYSHFGESCFKDIFRTTEPTNKTYLEEETKHTIRIVCSKKSRGNKNDN